MSVEEKMEIGKKEIRSRRWIGSGSGIRNNRTGDLPIRTKGNGSLLEADSILNQVLDKKTWKTRLFKFCREVSVGKKMFSESGFIEKQSEPMAGTMTGGFCMGFTVTS